MTGETNPQLTTKINPLSGQRQSGESDNAVIACNDWLRMGSGRSIRQLIDNYVQQATFSATYQAPTTVYGTARDWSSRFKWAERASEYDASWEARKNAERERMFNQELAQDFGRVRKLITLANMLESQIYEVGISKVRTDAGTFEEIAVLHNVWLPDVKQIGGGDNAERVDIERFNSALISEYRSTLNDIAKEVGGRTSTVKHSGDDTNPVRVALTWEQMITRDDPDSD